jgi:hypothetical protein
MPRSKNELVIPPLPKILYERVPYSTQKLLWEKWYAFWSLSLDRKADLVDEYPELIIERTSSPAAQSMGVPPSIYFAPEVLDVRVPYLKVMALWDTISDAEDYPLQAIDAEKLSKFLGDEPFELMPEAKKKIFLMMNLNAQNYAVLAYKYRYSIRPENYYFGMDYEVDLRNATTLEELLSFYV